MRENTIVGGLLLGRSLSHDINYHAHLQALIFDLYRDEKANKIYIPKFFKELVDAGIRKDDPRLREMIKQVREAEHEDEVAHDKEHLFMNKEAFCKCVGGSIGVIGKALKKQLVIPDWPSFTSVMTEIFEECCKYSSGQNFVRFPHNVVMFPVATYIPQLARADPNTFAASVCTVDGQRKSWGEALMPFCLQSVSKPFTYALVHEELGPDELHNHVGQEPSGRLFNDISLDHNKKPHNPLINAGAIVVASLMKRRASLSDRFDFVRFRKQFRLCALTNVPRFQAIHQMRRFCGVGYVGFNNAVFLSERETADRNYALSYYMREHKVFPPDTHLQDTLDLYFQLCSIETNCDTLAVMAATLANGGVNPMNGERVINNRCLPFRSTFLFVGLPAKSGVSGDMIMVIPNVMGIAIYSPRLDSLGNTYRGLKFAEAFIEKFNFHNYDSLVYSDCQKMDPRKTVVENDLDNASRFMYAAKQGDISAMKRYQHNAKEVAIARKILATAPATGYEPARAFFLESSNRSENFSFIYSEPEDKFQRTPLDDAKFFNHRECMDVIEKAIERWKAAEEQPRTDWQP
ncbi:glutaminase A [Necator americanus]|uniref:glutaminase n=1 Tax=Necator americanus TaxID=51031 RepID=W2SZ43_NECAM|nr:glutaminase A [Necator americanus]ETN74980.1 glutaminase A [Necator americanus]